MSNAPCYWITGLSAAGKTTISEAFVGRLRDLNCPVVFLDGDAMRGILNHNAYTREERLAFGYVYARLANHLTSQGIAVVVAVIGMFSELHKWNRENIGGYVEVFLDVPMIELERRDPKGIYKNFKAGLIKNVAGLDMKVDYPDNPDFHFVWGGESSYDYAVSILVSHYLTNIRH